MRKREHDGGCGDVRAPEAVDLSPKMAVRARNVRCDDAAKARILEELRAGHTLWSMLQRRDDIPGYDAIVRARKRDPQFDEAFQEARDHGMALRVEEAMEHQGSVRHDRNLSIAASRYAEIAVKVAEKLSPRTMGPLMRHAGHDAGKLTVTITEYKRPQQAIDSEAVELTPIEDRTESGDKDY